ncbi:hypothetical protein ACFVT5_28350 [Streptomyces sp. NPDC058001]|uniref:hypothetical protein n=1 Tax=Streptomyces sp. NPDC058001 TaxID=3346300 RepID=UPI0036E785E1
MISSRPAPPCRTARARSASMCRWSDGGSARHLATPPTAAELTAVAEPRLRGLTGVALTRADGGGEIPTLSRDPVLRRQRTST